MSNSGLCTMLWTMWYSKGKGKSYKLLLFVTETCVCIKHGSCTKANNVFSVFKFEETHDLKRILISGKYF